MVCLAFVAGSILMIRKGERMGWLCAAFFGLGIPVFLLQLWPKSSFLTVTEEGMEFCSLFRRSKVRWGDISEFGVTTIRQHGLPVNRMVAFNYSAEYNRAAKARSVAKVLSGFEGALPDTYGMDAEELAQVLTDFHREWSLKAVAEPRGAANPSQPVRPETNSVPRLDSCSDGGWLAMSRAWSQLVSYSSLQRSLHISCFAGLRRCLGRWFVGA